MALRVCRKCTTAFADGLPTCPHCGTKDSARNRYDWEEESSPAEETGPDSQARGKQTDSNANSTSASQS